ncbi:D-2-hydroxyacid dehydrogenase family protein [Pelagibacterium limicola]|uniref:D-2-hydroxyacid dehydrogenase family protein n=1 Tax=Pelagibacterium limicola TaxID=2791022 RepID=UPI0018AFCB5D|nr:D-2-hydroxyacid dehydrogenase family protein [Pelagibacterium limicola]
MVLKIAVLDDYQNVALSLADWSQLGREVNIEVFNENLATEDAAAEALADFDVLCLMRERMPLSAALIDRLPNLKQVNVTGARVRVIDMEHAAARGVTVCHTYAGDSRHATPEIAWALILAAARHLPQEEARMRSGLWQNTIGTRLGGKTIGIVGLGKLGSRMAKIAQGFEMEVIAWSSNLTDERAAECGVRRVDKDTLFREANVVSLHLVLSDRSRHTVGAHEIGLMKPGAILVNTSRGPLIDGVALLAALHENRIRAGLDVFDIEPLPHDHPLRSAPNCVLSPHLGYVTQETYEAFYRDTVENIIAWRKGAAVRVLAAPDR